MFLIGEFSKISRVSKRLLHHYDEIGLLKPAYIDPDTSYRFYSAKQLPRLNQILALKDLGLSLTQIGQMLDNAISDEEIHGMLMLKKAEINHDVELGYLLLKSLKKPIHLTSEESFEVQKLPAVQTMATMVQVGEPNPELSAFTQMAHWIEESGFFCA